MSSYNKKLLDELIQKELDGVLLDGEFEQLQSILKSSDDAVEYYSKSIILFSLFQGSDSIDLFSLKSLGIKDDNAANMMILKELAEDEEIAQAVETFENESIEPPKDESPTIDNRVRSQKIGKLGRIYNAAVTVAAVIMFLFIVYANLFPPQLSVQVATVKEQLDAVWNTSSASLTNGDIIYANQHHYKLDKGIIQFTYIHGVNVIVEAPAEFIIPAQNQIEMILGKTFVSVPESAIGFVVNTPTAKVVDLGTEFGVGVDILNTVRTIVYKGNVEMSRSSEQAITEKTLIVKGQLAVLEKHGQLTITEIPQDYSEFACDMNDYESGVSLLDRNLINNGDFEQDKVVYEKLDIDSTKLNNNNISIAGWQDTTPATINTYDTFGTGEIDALQRSSIPVPSDKGNNFFDGHKSCTITQEIDLEDISYKINRSEIDYELSGWVGGWHRQEDTLEFSASYLDNSGRLVEIATIKSLTASERNNKTCFVKRSKNGTLPEGVRKVIISLTTKLVEGETADAYADNLKFILSDNSIAFR